MIHVVSVEKESLQILCCVWSAESGAMDDALNGRMLHQYWRVVFVCERCLMMTKKKISMERLNDDVETAERFCYFGNALNASGDSEMLVVARTRIGLGFQECGEVLYRRRFSIWMKRKVYQICVKSAILFGSETRCLREKEMELLRRTEGAMIRAMWVVKLID